MWTAPEIDPASIAPAGGGSNGVSDKRTVDPPPPPTLNSLRERLGGRHLSLDELVERRTRANPVFSMLLIFAAGVLLCLSLYYLGFSFAKG
jgi:hypothetical protein